MIIDALTALPSTPTTGDELPIERGTNTYKIDYDELATAIINKLGTVLKPSDVVNDLTSTATDKPGSANMLKTLNDKIADLVKTEVRELHFGPNSISDALWATNSKYKLIGAYECSGSGYMVLPTNYNQNVCLFAWSGDSFLKNIDKTILICYIEQE